MYFAWINTSLASKQQIFFERPTKNDQHKIDKGLYFLFELKQNKYITLNIKYQLYYLHLIIPWIEPYSVVGNLKLLDNLQIPNNSIPRLGVRSKLIKQYLFSLWPYMYVTKIDTISCPINFWSQENEDQSTEYWDLKWSG